MTPLLPYLYITVKGIKFEKLSLSDRQNLRTVFNTSTACHKYCLINRDNLTQPFQMQSSLKRKTISQFFSPFFKLLDAFRKKMTLIADVFLK